MDGVVRHATRAAGEVLLTVGLVGLLFIGYLIWGTVIVTGVLVAAKPR
jgi:hypothetical protein